jgi:phosphatidylserine/phosphatidylglycerophosphate/cardiolipin synthase-like enzyme
MRPAFATVSDAAARLADQIPSSTIETLASAIAACEPKAATARALAACIPHSHYRALASCFVEVWQGHASDVPPVAAAMCLLGAAQSVQRHRSEEAAELVWTGPDVGVIPVRLTEQALLQVVDAARQRITVVSYAVYRIPNVCEALVRAADRGCSVRIILEQEGIAVYDAVAALEPAVLRCACIYEWPVETRPTDPRGHPGKMHVKAAVSDGERLLLSSANLTEQALTTNMELGVLITGGRLPGNVERQFDQLVATGVLTPVAGR